MARTALIIFTCCLMQLSISAQSKWHFGFRAGANIAYNNLSVGIAQSNIISRYNIGGLLLSVPLEYEYSDMFSLVSGFTYIQKGTSLQIRDPGSSRPYLNTFALDYLQVPLRGKLTLQLNRYQLYISAGMAFGYATDFRRIQSVGAEVSQKTKLDFQAANIHRMDVSLLGGGGFQVEIADRKRLFVEALLNSGIIDIDKHSEREVYNQGYSVTLGMMMPIKSGESEKP